MSLAASAPLRVIRLPVVAATRAATADYGVFIGTDVPNPGLTIPFYEGSVVEGHNLPFSYRGRAVVRVARIGPRSNEIRSLERHVSMTQLFVGLGGAPFVMVLGKPSQGRNMTIPDLAELAAFEFAPGHGIMIHPGTWHDFPLACAGPVTILTLNSEEVVDALAAATPDDEMDIGDVYRIDLGKRLGVRLVVEIP